MKLLLVVAALAVAVPSFAVPYFRTPKDWANKTATPGFATGACLDVIQHGPSSQCAALGIVTHSSKDGYFLVPGEDWSLLSVGYSLVGVSKVDLTLGPTMNVLPILVWMGEAAGLPIAIPSIAADGVKLDGSVGPAWVVDPQERWKGSFRLFAGGALHF